MPFWLILPLSLALILTSGQSATATLKEISLLEPRLSGPMSLEEAMAMRRSVRSFREAPLELAELSQLLWAAQGITEDRRGFRTAPSAGATYPLEVYIAAGSVNDLPPGLYKYEAQEHKLTELAKGDLRGALYDAALRQRCVKNAPIVIIIAAAYGRTMARYGERGIRYAHMEAGHSAQNICLQAISLGLGSVVVGAFNDESVKMVLSLPQNESPLYLVPIGRP
jgi:SagB-type dehydrogenase family enzyme